MPERLDVFAPILTKSVDPESGVLMIEGKITGPDLDHDQQRMSAEFLSRSVPAWYRIGNIREQHRSDSAVGKAVELWDTPDGSWHIRAKIVDKAAAAKIEHGVYTGFSIGINRPRIVKSADAPMGLITDGDIVETSICDRASLPTARLAVCKSLNGQPLDDVDQVEEIAEEASDLAKAETVEEVLAAVDFLAKTTAPTVLANPDDPDASLDAIEKAKGKKPFGGSKAKPFTAEDGGKGGSDPDGDGQHNRDDPDDDGDGTKDEDDADHPSNKKPAGKKPNPFAKKAADVDPTLGDLLTTMAERIGALEKRAPAADEPEPVADKTPEPTVTKGVGPDDEMADIARAKRILSDLACLVQSEAAGFLGGVKGEVWDLELLVGVMTQLTCFVEREEMEAAAMAENTPDGGQTTPDLTTPSPTVIQLAATADTTKAATAAVPNLATELGRRLEKSLKKARKAAAARAAAEAAQTADPTVTKTATTAETPAESAPAQGLTLDDLTKAMGPVMDRLAEVQARSEQLEALVKSTPRPGGPAVTRVQPAVSPARLAQRAEADLRKSALRSMLTGPGVTPTLRAEINRQIEQLDAT